jgi:hypothetical protein
MFCYNDDDCHKDCLYVLERKATCRHVHNAHQKPNLIQVNTLTCGRILYACFCKICIRFCKLLDVLGILTFSLITVHGTVR